MNDGTIENDWSLDKVIGIIGLGYVGLPLALAAAAAGYRVVGFDIDQAKVESLEAGRSYIKHIGEDELDAAIAAGRFGATTDFARLRAVDAIIVCVPTPLTAHRDPDLSYVIRTTEAITPHLRRGHLVVLESTTWPGTTDEVMKPILERSGLRSGEDFFLAYSPEREDPGNPAFTTRAIPKVVGGDGPVALRLADALYGAIVAGTVTVSSTRTAEAVKLTENIFRAVNIALVNELKVVYERMGVDVWEVIEAAKTKPFGYMPFYPGPGLGGHCIPIDPFYLTWKAREYETSTRFIELAGEINTAMPHYVVERLARAFDEATGRGLKGARVLLLGLAYKKNVDDVRESPAFKLIELLEHRGAMVDYYDPHVAAIPPMREYPQYQGRPRITLNGPAIAAFDVVLIATDHDDVDYRLVANNARLVIDTRNACARAGITAPHIVKA
ncbi:MULTISPECIES: nucleotide sugar dehydrogenase [unclassified Chelatococcus]|uniref:nucleotide sugar dehydrogenase n=1 Tax=unclassified Chelatococcus TaxID=2638111 RepID=UPI001BCA7A5B|nr:MULTISPECIES: nucleotide sugar dehydrogenase [unclassified Chelatococcus]CAH1667031.1 UDP-N-acetyl-D-glucosamine 6-dehydrogenase [Hyphomicrobiales bacterium]MBS7737974.1 nucleotide sugar dehydrogenase [Chelatococcus sp. HY11]MBX3546387.1 nucleotide sugar dehydrogenase [Chelatococcus sp.]MCO5077681.1 nucleotide sugar dehydrogenase [Chelatococcus sp.]CAH1680106.1 UDP-N-acetyl-D-glucosamine 6-dehydrogenase [Hyphomicrobiales bacterium]